MNGKLPMLFSQNYLKTKINQCFFRNKKIQILPSLSDSDFVTHSSAKGKQIGISLFICFVSSFSAISLLLYMEMQ